MKAVRRDPMLSARIVESFDLEGVRAGSALVRFDGRLLAIRNDAFQVAWIDPGTRQAKAMALRGQGSVLSEGFRPDFHSALVHEGSVWVLGSGSAPPRCYVSRIDMTSRRAPLFNATPMYAAIQRAIGRVPNIEGAVSLGSHLRLFHRVRGMRNPDSLTIDVSLDGFPGGTPRVLEVRHYRLGRLGAGLLGFTDATPLDGQSALAVAVSRDRGRVLGAAIGVVGEDGVRLGPIREADGSPCRRRIRGIALNSRRRTGWLITDPLDTSKPSRLCWAEFRLPS